MPMIESKISICVSQEKRDILKTEFGKAISILGKPESYLMLGFEDNYDLYFAGKKVEKGAFVSVKLFGGENSSACNEMTAKICEIFKQQLDIPSDKIYITYAGFKNWGWNGSNF
ncbi:phenylpyruvate tautomerase MIF-related protein [Treponema pectinovorum]|uniref:phenylpyruvate tautomerase MIF-related protein n=1 Tax=Treponema pectinovorum TaxID=164 RepID=UPI0011CC8EAD|nr:phenylpyruvate tautomerase MIF-related protein [Treponema pectinovorum]